MHNTLMKYTHKYRIRQVEKHTYVNVDHLVQGKLEQLFLLAVNTQLVTFFTYSTDFIVLHMFVI